MSEPPPATDVDAALQAAGYARMRWNCPLSPDHAALLLDVLAVRDGHTVLDLGCGWGELLLRAVESGSGRPQDESSSWPVAGVTGIGVDVDADAIDRARRLADERMVADRVTFVTAAAADWTQPADRAICIGAAHAYGGSASALHALTHLVPPGGRLLYGDACWPQPPSPAALDLFGEDDIRTLPDLADDAAAAGWRVLHLSTADQREWDVFESTWRAGRQEWLLAHPGAEQAAAVRDRLDDQQRTYLRAYRGVLGFAYLVLAR